MLLAGDIGGTKTDLALFTAGAGPRKPAAQAEFHSAAYPDLTSIVREFLAKVPSSIDAACFAVAGPVIRGRAELTNLSWVVDEADLSRQLEIGRVRILNDVEADAWAIPTLQPEDTHTLAVGKPVQGGALAVVAPGTGLGEAYLNWDGSAYRPQSSEGGHADFAPLDAGQDRLLAYLRERHGHVSVERVCSGPGIATIYACLRDAGDVHETPEMAARLASAADPTPVIVESALSAAPSELCAKALAMFVEILGAEAGNFALKVLATGGVYLAGGIPPRMLPLLETAAFLNAFRSKGRLSGLLTDIPVHVITARTALFGAGACAALMVGGDAHG